MTIVNPPPPSSPPVKPKRKTTTEDKFDSEPQVEPEATDDEAVDQDDLARQALELKSAVYTRLNRDGRWTKLNIAGIRDDMMRQCTKGKRMPKLQAQIWTYGEIDRLYPPETPKLTGDEGDDAAGNTAGDAGDSSNPGESAGDQAASGGLAHAREKGQQKATNGTDRDTPCQPVSPGLQGISDIPEAWGDLPDNAALAAEIAWVQANRLRVVQDQGTTTIVRLGNARVPAPSWSTLGWLETSIRNYAKFVDVSAKVTANSTDEAEFVRRERMAIDEIRELLDEMHED